MDQPGKLHHHSDHRCDRRKLPPRQPRQQDPDQQIHHRCPQQRAAVLHHEGGKAEWKAAPAQAQPASNHDQGEGGAGQRCPQQRSGMIGCAPRIACSIDSFAAMLKTPAQP